jgi:hypothetical protein
VSRGVTALRGLVNHVYEEVQQLQRQHNEAQFNICAPNLHTWLQTLSMLLLNRQFLRQGTGTSSCCLPACSVAR